MGSEQAQTVPLDTMHSVEEVGRRLGLKTATIRKMVLERKIDVFRPSKRAVRVSEKTIQAILSKGFRPAVN